MDWAAQLIEYEKPKMSFIDAHVASGVNTYSKFIDTLRQFYILSLFLAERKFKSKQFTMSRIKQLYAKSALDTYSIYICLRNGLNVQTASLIRSQFETFVTTKTLFSGEIPFKTELYVNYEHVENWLYMRSKRRLVEKNILTKGEYDRIFPIESQDTIREKYFAHKAYYHPKNPYHWAWFLYKDELKGRNPNLKDMSERCGLGDDYHRTYGLFSTSVHSSPLLGKWMTSKRGVNILPQFSDLTKGYALLSLNYLVKSIKLFAEQWMEDIEYESLKSFIDANHQRAVKNI